MNEPSLAPPLRVVPARGAAAPAVVFMFTGLGSEYARMGRRLFGCSPVFRREIEACDALYQQTTGTPLIVSSDAPFGDGARLRRADYAQPALFAFEYALAQVWRAAGVEPDAVIGYSLGEDVAACVAGAVSRDEGLGFVIARARMVEEFDDGGDMAAIFDDERSVRQRLTAYRGISVAAVNGRENTVVAGPARALDALLAELGRQGIRTRRMPIGHAFHSALMEPLLSRLEDEAARVRFQSPRIPVVSTATGQWATARSLSDPRAWSRRICETVRFSDALAMVYAQGFRVFVEIGPHPVLLSIATRCLDHPGFVGIPALRRGADDVLLTAAGLAAAADLGIALSGEGFDGMPRGAFGTPGGHPRAEAS